jgi:hypothetical protein
MLSADGPLTLTALSALPHAEKVIRVDAPYLCEAYQCDGDVMICVMMKPRGRGAVSSAG